MEEPRPEKVAAVAEVKKKFEDADAVFITEYRGLSVGDLQELRGEMSAGGGEYRVFKNTMVRRAAAELGLDISEHLTGPTALAFISSIPDGQQGDIATVAKAVKNFSKKNPNLVVKGGILGEDILDANATIELASLPTADEIYARIAGGVNGTARGLASMISGMHRSLAYVLQASIDANAFAGDAPDAAEDAPAEEPAAESTDAESTDAKSTSAEEADETEAVGASGDETPSEESDGAPTADATPQDVSDEAQADNDDTTTDNTEPAAEAAAEESE